MTDKEAFDIGLRLGTAMRLLDIATQALEKIANQDFRGNRPQGAEDAYFALKRMEDINKSTVFPSDQFPTGSQSAGSDREPAGKVPGTAEKK